MTDASFDYTTRILWPAETEFMVPAAGAAFSPSSLSGLKFWYDATVGVFSDAGVTPANNDDTVQQWNDQSGSGAHLKQSSSTERPTYKTTGLNSLPTLRCVSDYMLSDADSVAMGSDKVWCFFVASAPAANFPSFCGFVDNTNPNNSRVAGNADWCVNHALTSGNFFGIVNASGSPSVTALNDVGFQWGIVANGTTCEVYKNTVASGSPSSVTGSLSATGRSLLNATGADGSNAQTVDMSEFFGGTGDLSGGDLTNIFAYLAAKWGL